MCLYPRLIKNRKYVANKKNKGKVPQAKDKRVLLVPVGCGKCMECRKQKARNWQVRLHEEIRTNKTGRFVTLSFSDESLVELENLTKEMVDTETGEITEISGYNLDNAAATLAIRRFLGRWRKKYKVSVRHWLCTELGQKKTERIHIHGLLFTTESAETIQKIWKYGNVFIGNYVTERTINYIVKYISKIDEKHREYMSKIFTSPGMGSGYIKRPDAKLNKYKGDETKEIYTTRDGTKLALPIYYRNHIYNEEEREKLWLQKLDEQIRWVNGRKVDVSGGEEEYYKILKEERKRNKRLGFGDSTVDWEKRKYEDSLRNLKRWERLKKVEKIR